MARLPPFLLELKRDAWPFLGSGGWLSRFASTNTYADTIMIQIVSYFVCIVRYKLYLISLCYYYWVIAFKLQEFLKAHNITPYEFGKHLEEKGVMSAVAVRKFAKSDRYPRDTSLSILIAGLREYTGKNVEVSDLLEYIPDPPKKIKK